MTGAESTLSPQPPINAILSQLSTPGTVVALSEAPDHLLAMAIYNLIVSVMEWRHVESMENMRQRASEIFPYVYAEWRSVTIDAVPISFVAPQKTPLIRNRHKISHAIQWKTRINPLVAGPSNVARARGDRHKR